VIFLLCSQASFADSVRPATSYKVVTANGKYIFIMHPVPAKDRFYKGRDKALLKEYPETGLYTNDQHKTLLWSVDWYAQVFVSSDGKHLIRMGGWPRGSPLNRRPEGKFDPVEMFIKVHNQEPVGPSVNPEALSQLAIAFYDRGTLIKEYSIGDLIRKPAELPESVSHFSWSKKISYDDKNGKIGVTTQDGQVFTFDLNGHILHRKNL